jgi:hypothetical protein
MWTVPKTPPTSVKKKVLQKDLRDQKCVPDITEKK